MVSPGSRTLPTLRVESSMRSWSEHGYLDVLLLDPTNIVYPTNEIRRADVRKRRFVPGYYFELELTDGTVDRRDILVARAKREKLEELLKSQGYN